MGQGKKFVVSGSQTRTVLQEERPTTAMGIFVDAINYFIAHPQWLLLIGLVYVFLYLISLAFSSPKPGKNPFHSNSIRPTSPLQTDRSKRDKVLKQSFHSTRIPEGLDAVVVGSGVGGLSVAAVLSKAGKKVLVLEQHDQAGGCCHTFEEKGFEFDVGIHYIGEMRNNTVSRLLVDQLTNGQLQWTDLVEDFDQCALGEAGKQKWYPFHTGSREVWKKHMLEKFPNEEAALDKYLDKLKEARRNVLGLVTFKLMPQWLTTLLIKTGLVHVYTKYFLLAGKTTQQVLDSITDNQDLKAVLTYSYGDYGTIPKDSSFAMHAMLINHYMFGASYPRGGASEIAYHMIPVIESAGGRVLVRATVSKILVENNRAVGVRVKKGEEYVDIFAPTVISDAGVANTFSTLLPKEVAAKSRVRRVLDAHLRPSIGCMQVFVGLNGTAKDLQLEGKNVWAHVSNDLNGSAEKYCQMTAEEAASSDAPLLFISFPSVKDPTYNERYPGKSVCTIVGLAPFSWFSQWKEDRVMKRGSDYDGIKMGIARRMWEQTLEIFPQLRDRVEYFEAGSPATTKHYMAYQQGETYGLDHTVKRFGNPEVASLLRPETDIPGLFLTGQDVFACGFTGAMFGGVLCASRLLNRNLWQDLLALKAKIGKTN